MMKRQWFRCDDQVGSAVEPDALRELRCAVTDVYRDECADEHALVVVSAPPAAAGFDRLALPLAYTKVLDELPIQSSMAVPGRGNAVTLVTRDRELPAAMAKVRMRLSQTVSADPPQVAVRDLPARLRQALRLVNELCE